MLIKQLSILLLLIVSTQSVLAEVAADQAERLGNDLMPLGGERAGNAEGTIPEWQGGLTQPPSAYQAGGYYTDPFSDDQPLFEINNSNVNQHASKLTPGHQKLLSTYPESYKLLIYPTKRSAAAPERIYAATKQIATTAKLTEDGNGVEGAAEGTPFPIPSNGLEVIWNHMLRWRGVDVKREVAQVAPTRAGDFTPVKFKEELIINYSREGVTAAEINNIIIYFKQEVLSPARLAGGILLVHETLNQNREKRNAWLYNPGQRRVRRAPNVAFDNPGTASDGLRTNDQLDMFNGSPEKYNWELKGKQEFYVPYNNYRISSPDLNYKDIVTPLHINQELVRYELHRVWVVDATLKSDERHIYKRRTFYVDEDSWQILHVDQYDNRDQIWRVSEGLAMNYYNVPNLWTTAEVHTDLQAGRYLVIGLDNESSPYDFNVEFSDADFSPAALRRQGRR
ncbi:MAG: DUF1329 domain-containing protein [Pseudomonadota bacterium]